MSALYGTIRGAAKTEATRRGDRELTVTAASWTGAVRTTLEHDAATGRTLATVELVPWHGAGASRVLWTGDVSGEQDRLTVGGVTWTRGLRGELVRAVSNV